MDYLSLICNLKLHTEKAKILNLGSSVLGRTLFGVYYDFGSKHNILIHGSIHAREHITTDLICHLMNIADKNYAKFYGKLPNILFIPMVNPDGVQLCNFGLKSVKNTKFSSFLKEINNNSEDFTMFKANVNGVDLNNNFDADFGKDPRYSKVPASHGFAGYTKVSEPESKMLVRVAGTFNPVFTISYHCKGEEIYFNYNLSKNEIKKHKKIANIFARRLKYKVVSETGQSCGGFKDYCVLRKNIPSLTIEVGKDSFPHPLPKEALCDIIKKHKCFYAGVRKAYKNICKKFVR